MAAVNASTLIAVRDNFNALFTRSYQDAPVWHPQLAMLSPSKGAKETYQWLNDVPQLREWLGERGLKDLTGFDYTLTNKKWEASIKVKREDIERDVLGLYNPRIQDLGFRGRKHGDRLIGDLIVNGHTDLIWDGKAFFANDHPIGPDVNDNLLTGGVTAANFEAAIKQLRQQKGGNGEPIVGSGRFLLVVGPAGEKAARELLNAEIIINSAGTASGTNIWKGAASLLVVDELGTNTHWMLSDIGFPLKPFIYQKETEPRMAMVTDPNDSHVFTTDEFMYGVDYRGNAGYGLYFFAVGSTG